jgi:regulatory protein
VTRRAAKPGRKQPAAPADSERPRLDRPKLEQFALAYLNRFDVSSRKLEQHLRTRAKRLGAPEEVGEWITELIARYRGSGLLNDARYAEQLAGQLAARGKSSRAIAQKLAARGVASQLSNDVLNKRQLEEPDAELSAARAYARKRRLGSFRPLAERDEFRRKDLASLVRQGFSFDVARKALGPGASTDDEF